MTYKLLIVDDEMPNIRLLERVFHQDYYCLTASSGEEALALLDQHEVAVIISDQRMPNMTGIELLKRSAERRPHMVRILLTGYTDLEALVEAVNCGLVYTYVSKPWNNDDLKLRVSRAVELYENNKRQHSLAANNERLSSRLQEMKSGFVRAMGGLLQRKDPYLCSHAIRVSKSAALLGEKLGLSDQLLTDMTAAPFVRDYADVVTCIRELKETLDMVAYHDENFDGSGKPLGLIGSQIPLPVRILRIATEYDLLTNPRLASEAVSPEAAMQRLGQASGKHFDPVVMQAFSEVVCEMTELVVQ